MKDITTHRGIRSGGRARPRLTLPVPPEWVADALCAQTDPEAFFPDKGGTTKPAKRVCADCPVTEQCLAYALATGQRFGVWGGLSERERRRLLHEHDGRAAA